MHRNASKYMYHLFGAVARALLGPSVTTFITTPDASRRQSAPPTDRAARLGPLRAALNVNQPCQRFPGPKSG